MKRVKCCTKIANHNKIFVYIFIDRGLFPNIFNLATNAIISANATCGKKWPESYCKLVEHVFMRSVISSGSR